ncbi:Aspartic proteinase nepenthesin-2 [Linum grandiflorum]
MPPSPSTLFSFLFILISTASAATIAIPLSPYTTSSSAAPPPLHEILSHLASTSLSRALKLKHSSPPPPPPPPSPSSLVTTPLFPRSYGGYSISLSFGTPPQTTKFVMDTGSTLVWFPCTSRYICSRCNFLGAKRFSYCLVSHRFDETSVSSDLVLDLDSKKTNKKKTKNPDSSNSAFQTYYYLMLRQILVQGKRVKVPYKYLEPSKSDGNGGTIVDSGTTFSYMEGPVYEAVAAAIVNGMMSNNYTVAKDVQDLTGLRPCFDVSTQDTLTVPQLSFKFKGGAEMELPVTNYFVLVTEKVICFTIVSDSVIGKGAGGGGPSIILGNYQQRDYNVEYDLENERFGFKKQKCA